MKGSPRKLAASIKKATGVARPKGMAAHHIVASNAPDAASARLHLQDLGIDINDAANGIYLPATKELAAELGMVYHPGMHGTDYYAWVNDLITSGTTRDEVLEALDDIRATLAAGKTPWLDGVCEVP